MYETFIHLLGTTSETFDAQGNPKQVQTDTTVFAMPRTVYQQEFYNAAQLGLHPTITFELANRFDYNGEKLIYWPETSTYYAVIRADWTGQRDGIRLICEERVGLYQKMV